MAPEWKVEVSTDNGQSWASNALRFDTLEKAKAYGQDLFSRWTAVTDWRVVMTKLVDKPTS